MSELTEQLSEARRDPQKGYLFYDAFLNSKIVVPVRSLANISPSFRSLSLQERFHPLFLSGGETTHLVPVFETVDGLRAWAGETALDYIQLSACAFVLTVDASVALVLNPGTETQYVFPAELLNQLRSGMKELEQNESS